MPLRPELTPPPARIARLPVDARGYPVPWFVEWVNGVPEFRAMDPRKWIRAVRDRRCWVCGDPLGRWLTFAIGPMCAITRTTSEPACHRDCAEWAVINCPFLSRPHMVRREAGLPPEVERAPGFGLLRNPGVTCLWATTTFTTFRVPAAPGAQPGYLITMGAPHEVQWYAEGRAATRAEIEASIAGGYPALEALCEQEQDRGAARAELAAQRAAVSVWIPAQ